MRDVRGLILSAATATLLGGCTVDDVVANPPVTISGTNRYLSCKMDKISGTQKALLSCEVTGVSNRGRAVTWIGPEVSGYPNATVTCLMSDSSSLKCEIDLTGIASARIEVGAEWPGASEAEPVFEEVTIEWPSGQVVPNGQVTTQAEPVTEPSTEPIPVREPEVISGTYSGLVAAMVDPLFAFSGTTHNGISPARIFGSLTIREDAQLRLVAYSGRSYQNVVGGTLGESYCPSLWAIRFLDTDGKLLSSPQDATKVASFKGTFRSIPYGTSKIYVGFVAEPLAYKDNEGAANIPPVSTSTGGCTFKFEIKH